MNDLERLKLAVRHVAGNVPDNEVEVNVTPEGRTALAVKGWLLSLAPDDEVLAMAEDTGECLLVDRDGNITPLTARERGIQRDIDKPFYEE